ncbi:deoxyguanosinetriphosphate triphosphohydrolase [Halothermothrix orenii]|uniref:Deoxyguanosinetriphosphate triphosphohydrolase-like protein n=1 Tax=Halothermothrix orenii (strain H 168 / OCM 544 / DSM 9562) TaxID=373903 RepID=B8CXH3_HALOH|nr:deoxyguanosinetriphosphate triphosphohydrolase [Halothermothrix orenii]ACL69992.1 Deoxyguanosinetriphosphate triphosphohydrolase [Halothermothrix orenii H 168]
MNGRTRIEQIEEEVLSPYACLSKNSRGRLKTEDECNIRTIFQRDRDRIIHSKAFRRLKHKTQVFIAPEGDHYRTRLTHTLEVSQIARTIARGLGLNEDLTEAIALGHDLGHTPFGHAGEEVLDEISSNGFSHNVQSLRVVDYLEVRNSNLRGLNLSYEVRDGILTHTGKQDPSTLEGQIVKIADRIAYINHDIDDALRGGIISEKDLPHTAIKILGNTHSDRIDTMVRDIIRESWNKSVIKRSRDVAEATTELRQFLFENVYIGSKAKKEENKAKNLVKKLYYYYLDHPREIPDEFKQKEGNEDIEQMVIDYIAGMTDRYAIKMGQELFLPSPWG